MTLNEVNIIKNSVLDATEAYVDARLAVADFVKTQIGVTQGTPTQSGGKYYHTVLCNSTSGTSGITYNNVLSIGNIEFPDGSVVFLIAPNAQFTNQFILGKLDNTPCNIVGGSIKIGRIGTSDNYYFNVDSTGKLNINNKFIVENTGKLDINGKFIVENTGKLNINNKFIVENTGKLNINDKFIVENTGALYIGGTSSSTANFYVTNTGNVTAKQLTATVGGDIGGFTINGSTGLKREGSNNDLSEMTADHFRVSKWDGTHKISAMMDANNERIVISSDSGTAEIQVTNRSGWGSSTSSFPDPDGASNYFKLTPTSLKAKADGTVYTCGTPCFKFLSQCQNAGDIGNLEITVSSGYIMFRNVDSNKDCILALT